SPGFAVTERAATGAAPLAGTVSAAIATGSDRKRPRGMNRDCAMALVSFWSRRVRRLPPPPPYLARAPGWSKYCSGGMAAIQLHLVSATIFIPSGQLGPRYWA